MNIEIFKKDKQHEVAEFFKSIFKELDWEIMESDNLNDPAASFHLPQDGILLLVYENNQLIGTAGLVKFDNEDALIKRFFIHEAHRGTGVAQKLLNTLIEKAKDMKFSRLVLDVYKTNKRAKHFYEKGNFIPFNPAPIDVWPESKFPDTFDYYCYNIIHE